MARDDPLPPGKRCRGNLRPAPFFLAPSTIGQIIALAERPAPRVANVPIAPVKLVDRPRSSANPALAKANDDPEEAASTSESLAPRGPELQPAARVDSRSGPDEGSVVATASAAREPLREPQPCGAPAAAESAPVEPDQLDWPDAPLPDEEAAFEEFVSKTAAAGFQTADRVGGCEGRAPEGSKGPANGFGHSPRNARQPHTISRPDRRELIRVAAARIPLRAEPAPAARPLAGERAPRNPVSLPANPFEERRQALDDAIGFLGTKGILVTVYDRGALVRRYRVSGKRDLQLAADVIAIARSMGLRSGGSRG